MSDNARAATEYTVAQVGSIEPLSVSTLTISMPRDQGGILLIGAGNDAWEMEGHPGRSVIHDRAVWLRAFRGSLWEKKAIVD